MTVPALVNGVVPGRGYDVPVYTVGPHPVVGTRSSGGAEAASNGAKRAGLEASLTTVIGKRLNETRRRQGVSLRLLAERSGISKGMLSRIENAQVSPSLTTLARIAEILEIPVTSFFRGFDEERDAVFVKAGHGAEILGQGAAAGHRYQQLGTMRGQHARMLPLLVTLNEPAEVFPLFQHPGTELLYMLSGTMTYGHGRAVYVLEPGDALQFDGEASHGPVELLELPIRFLSITAVGMVHDHG
jgi:transcriptional regulator with XRE-family HTH domain